jgi:hypothetical protein
VATSSCSLAASVTRLAAAALVAMSLPVAGATTDYEVKAAYLYNFLSFVTWPPSFFDGPASPLRLCIAAPDPFGPVINDTMRGEQVEGRPIAVERLRGSEGAQRCHVLFVPAAAANGAELMRAVEGAPVLVVGETDEFLERGGVVRFFLDAGHVRFDISRTAAERRGLMLSSRLLQVARRVG